MSAARDRTGQFRAAAEARAGYRVVDDGRCRRSSPLARALDQWRAGERAPTDAPIPVAQLRTAAISALRHALAGANNAQHAAHLALVLRDAQPADEAPVAVAAVEPTADEQRAAVAFELAAPVEYHSERARRVRYARRQLVETGALVCRVAELVERQGAGPLAHLERNVERATARIDDASAELWDAAPRVYRTWRWRVRRALCPHSLPARLRLALALLLAAYLTVWALAYG